ncbi:hypothetical protein [Paenibacillus sp. ATY16]|uniref:hypothetical protein n=1 Tax=Paenibacillus sp. ATY16 TaxID=1759312 RepID=UPI00200D36BF|nr:hypothetical protein [Paenibacillus sp. ATY16]MCK9861367.1 hypothetical protein [Paenibacillus sp. ATY16]
MILNLQPYIHKKTECLYDQKNPNHSSHSPNLLFAGCAVTVNKDKATQRLLPDENWIYTVHVFAGQENYTLIGKELTRFQNSSTDLQKGFRVQFWDVGVENHTKRAIALGLANFPTILIVDKDGIVLETQDIPTIERYLTSHLMK